MNNIELEKYLKIVNEEKEKRGLTDYLPLYPMFRKEDNKLYIGVMLTKKCDNVWSDDEEIKPEYWVLIDIQNENIIAFNKTKELDFVINDPIPKNKNNKTKEISKYTVKKTLEYENYLLNDIKNEELPIQKKISNILGKSIKINEEDININDYLLANFEEEIKGKIKELVEILIRSKYTSITYYYDSLFNDIINEYKKDNIVNNDKIKLLIEIMNNYYDGVIYIDNFFNI